MLGWLMRMWRAPMKTYVVALRDLNDPWFYDQVEVTTNYPSQAAYEAAIELGWQSNRALVVREWWEKLG